MNEHGSNGEDKSAVVLEFFDGRIRQIERRQDAQDAEVRADLRKLEAMMNEDRKTFGEAHSEIMERLKDLSDELRKPRRRSPKTGKP